MTLKFKRIGTHALSLPSRGTPLAAGLDLRTRDQLVIYPGEKALIHTGFAVEIPPNYEGTIRPRSSMSKRGLHIYFGTIDADYRGELLIGVQNISELKIEIPAGDRIAQLVISRVELYDPVEVEELSDTERGAGGFGSTGQA